MELTMFENCAQPKGLSSTKKFGSNKIRVFYSKRKTITSNAEICVSDNIQPIRFGQYQTCVKF